MPGEEMGTKKIRAFVALKTPPDWDIELGKLQEDLKSELRTKSIRWTKPEQVHITLRFLDSISREEAEIVAAALPAICEGHEPFSLQCEGLGCFPNVRRARVLWVGIGGAVERVRKLQEAVVLATREVGKPPEKRLFKPHLTLGRIEGLERSNIERLENLLEGGFRIETEWRVTEVLLMQSHLSSHGARYETIARCELGRQEL